jgi:hypothetical protein
MTVLLARVQVKEEAVPEVEAAIEKMFAAIHAAAPEGLRYAHTKAADGVTFVVFVQIDNPQGNPLTTIPEVGEFQQWIEERLDDRTPPESLTVVGSYHLFE